MVLSLQKIDCLSGLNATSNSQSLRQPRSGVNRLGSSAHILTCLLEHGRGRLVLQDDMYIVAGSVRSGLASGQRRTSMSNLRITIPLRKLMLVSNFLKFWKETLAVKVPQTGKSFLVAKSLRTSEGCSVGLTRFDHVRVEQKLSLAPVLWFVPLSTSKLNVLPFRCNC